MHITLNAYLIIWSLKTTLYQSDDVIELKLVRHRVRFPNKKIENNFDISVTIQSYIQLKFFRKTTFLKFYYNCFNVYFFVKLLNNHAEKRCLSTID